MSHHKHNAFDIDEEMVIYSILLFISGEEKKIVKQKRFRPHKMFRFHCTKFYLVLFNLTLFPMKCYTFFLF